MANSLTSQSFTAQSLEAQPNASSIDVAIVGAGFAGLYMLHKCNQRSLSAAVFEAGDGVGGTWYWNRYPGARCDVESLEYSYSFDEELQQEWEWSERYAGQPEILAYLNHVADRFDLRSKIQFETRVEAAEFNSDLGRWAVETTNGDVDAQFVVMATGCLSSTNKPQFEAMTDFKGPIYHTGEWPHDGVDFSGQRVGVIGTGSSAVQSIPLIAAQAEHLTVFQRTPNYSVPAHNGPMDKELEAETKANYPAFRRANLRENGAFGSRISRGEISILDFTEDDWRQEFERRWRLGGFAFLRAYPDLLLDDSANAIARQFVSEKIADVVTDPETAALLTPKQVIGCKRLCLDTHYFETFNRDNVDLVDVSDTPIERFTPEGLVVDDREFSFDAIVTATGFDAMTGTILKIDIKGRNGLTLAEKWAEGPKTYLGLCVPGFPNMFMVTGPGSPSVLTNMVMAIEQHVEWIDQCISDVGSGQHQTIEATDEAEQQWVAHVNAVADLTLMPTCNSWYLGVNVPGKPRVFMPLIGFPPYVEKCNEVVANGYEGFVLASPSAGG